MNKLQKLAIGFTIITASLVSAFAAPSATRHNKLLSIKQRVMIDTGESRTSASLVSPTAHSTRSGLVTLTNTFAAIPLSAVDVAKFQISRVPRFNYEAFWINMDALQACENQLSNNAAAYNAASYGSSPYTSDSGEYASYVYQAPPPAPGAYADGMLGGGYSATALPPQYATGDITACTTGVDSAVYAAAIRVRQAVGNYARDSQEVLDYVTSQIWIKESGAANSLKAAVVQYLRENEIEHAWVDIEFEYLHQDEPKKRRVSMSFQINRADEPTTRGSYMGSQLILAPDASIAEATMNVRSNTIEIKYTAYSQYPDFTINSNANSAYLNQKLVGKYNPNGLLSWNITKIGASAISSRLCSNITTCTETTGQFKATSGAYDPTFMRVGGSIDPNVPYTLENIGAISDLSGINCLVTGRGNANCRLEKHNVATLMQYSNAISGTLDYLGRWEVDFDRNKPTFEEHSRAGVFDVCYGVEFKNQASTRYWVRRPYWKLKLYWQPSGVQYQQAQAPEYDYFEIAKLPDPVTYTTYPTPRNNYNLVGSGNDNNTRANQISAQSSETAASNYAAVNLSLYDPQTFGLPDREGAIMINPFVSSVTSTGVLYNGAANNWMIYRPFLDITPEMTVASRMTGEPIYKKAAITASNALPTGWLARNGNKAEQRTADFNCVDQNEPRIRQYLGLYSAIPPTVTRRGSPPDEPIRPSGDRIFENSLHGHKSGTRPDVNSFIQVGTGATADPCQISYVSWSDVISNVVAEGPLRDPDWTAPPICSTTVGTGADAKPYPGLECIHPVNYYTKRINVTNAQNLTYVNSIEPACNEECTVGGNVKLCPRPYNRF